MTKPFINRIGKVYGFSKVIALHKHENSIYWWRCLCKCGKERIVRSTNLKKYEKYTQCKCGRKVSKKIGAPIGNTYNRKHGLSTTKEYHTWKNMITNCYDENKASYKFYGKKGIGVCDRWKNSFENFINDMEKCQQPNNILGRKKTNKDYSPENCEWTTLKKQHSRKSNVRNITFKGETKILSEWAREFGISPQIFTYWLKKMSIKEAYNKAKEWRI